jgi:hypothetical protein
MLMLVACKSATGPGTGDDDVDDLGPDSGMPQPPPDSTSPDGAASLCEQAVSRSDFTFIQDTVFTPSCATAKCHTGPEPEVGLDLSAGTAYANLVNKGASTVTGWTRVVPGSKDESYLVVAFGRAPGPAPRDGFMPIGAPALCAEQHDMIERWIAAGAPDD